MKKLIIILSFIAAIIAALMAFGSVDAILLFIVVGVVPGTNYIVPANTMLTAIMAISWIVLLPLVSFKNLYKFTVRQLEKLSSEIKKHAARPSFLSKA
jgi:hypothetical protein